MQLGNVTGRRVSFSRIRGGEDSSLVFKVMEHNWRQLALYVVITILGGAFSLGYGVLYHDHPAATAGEMVFVAQNLAQNGEFANPFPTRKTGPTAAVAPAYAFLLAGLFKVFGREYGGLAMMMTTALVHGLHTALLILLSRRILQDPQPGIWAAVLAGVFPIVRFLPAWEAILAAVGLIMFCLFSFRWVHECPGGANKFALLGVMAGILVLLHPVAALVAVVWISLLLRDNWRALRKPFVLAGCFGLMLFATPLPWTIRNRVVLGTPAIKIGFWGNLEVSNNDCASSNFVMNFRSGCQDRHNPQIIRADADIYAAMGEVKSEAHKKGIVIAWIKENPAVFLRLTGKRILEFWLPNLAEGPYAVTISLITILSGAGFVLMVRKRVPFLRFAFYTSLIYPLPYYLVVSDSRYRIPILWISLLSAGYFLHALWERLVSRQASC